MPELKRMNSESVIRVAVAGEALIDLIADTHNQFTPCLGGAVYNLARALSRQGIATAYLNPLSTDRFGQALTAQLRTDGVHIAQQNDFQAPTSLAVVSLDDSGHPDYAFYREGVADRQINSQQLEQLCQSYGQLEVICTGALALDARDSQIYVPWLEQQKSLGQCVVVDANLRPSVMPDLQAYRNSVMRSLKVANIIKVGDEDLYHLQIEGNSTLEQAEHLLKITSAQCLALTMGEKGAWLLMSHGVSVFAREAGQLPVADTVGAGDSFLAGLLVWLLKQRKTTTLPQYLQKMPRASAQEALQHALASASLCVQQQGCVPPSWEQAQTWAAQHPCIYG